MKKRFLNSIRNSIKKQYPNYSNDKIDEIMYGVEGIYLTITKTIIIFALAFLFKIAKELLFLLIAFNFIRLFAFGMHANNSIACLIFSSLMFIGGVFICISVKEKNPHIYNLEVAGAYKCKVAGNAADGVPCNIFSGMFTEWSCLCGICNYDRKTDGLYEKCLFVFHC